MLPPDKPTYYGKCVPRQHWARFAFLSEHGDQVREQTRQERRDQGLPEKVTVIL